MLRAGRKSRAHIKSGAPVPQGDWPIASQDDGGVAPWYSSPHPVGWRGLCSHSRTGIFLSPPTIPRCREVTTIRADWREREHLKPQHLVYTQFQTAAGISGRFDMATSAPASERPSASLVTGPRRHRPPAQYANPSLNRQHLEAPFSDGMSASEFSQSVVPAHRQVRMNSRGTVGRFSFVILGKRQPILRLSP
jgi:hypothetical protein